MGGCLGPKQRKQEVYIQVIQTIHQEVTHMTFVRTENLDMYSAMKQKLSKKGLLRKLIDNLVSHRNKIYDSLNHNYEIVLQHTRLQNKYAGLLIIDQIIEGIYQTLKASSKQIPFENQPDEFTNMSSTQNHNPVPNLQESVQQIFGEKTRKPSKLEAAMMGNPLIRQIDSRFDMIYFNLIWYLLNDVSKMYLRILKSMNSFAFHKKRKFNCTETVWHVMDFIMEKKISKKNCLKESILTYKLLLQSTKENFKEYQKPSDLKTFIKLWMEEKKENKSPDLAFSSTFGQESQISPTQQEEDLLKNLISIIALYFNTNISTWNSQYLYDILIDLYDEEEFEMTKVGKFENAIFKICDRNDLRVHFFRGLFIMLLEYLCYRQGEKGSRVLTGMHGSAEDIKWPNNGKKHVKFNALKTLRRWVNQKHVDLNQTVSYNCSLLFSAYLTNFHPMETQMNTEISKEFLKLVRQHLENNSKQILVMTIIQAIKQPETDSRIRTIIVNLMRQLLEDENIFSQFQDNFGFIMTIDEHYSKENQLEIIQMMGFIVKTLPDSFFKQESDLNSSEMLAFKHKICEFLYSCFEVLVYSSAEEVFKYQFCCSVVSFLRAIQIKKNVSFVYAFYQELIKEIIQPSSIKHISSKNYFVLYLIYEIAHLLVEDIQVPLDFRMLNEKISSLTVYSQQPSGSNRSIKSPKKDQVNLLIEKIVKQDKYSEPDLIKEEFHQQHIQNELKRRNLFSQENLDSTSKILAGYFANSCVRSKNISTKDQNYQQNEFDKLGTFAGKSTIVGSFGRRDSIYHDSQNGSFYKEEDKNLKDLLGIING